MEKVREMYWSFPSFLRFPVFPLTLSWCPPPTLFAPFLLPPPPPFTDPARNSSIGSYCRAYALACFNFPEGDGNRTKSHQVERDSNRHLSYVVSNRTLPSLWSHLWATNTNDQFKSDPYFFLLSYFNRQPNARQTNPHKTTNRIHQSQQQSRNTVTYQRRPSVDSVCELGVKTGRRRKWRQIDDAWYIGRRGGSQVVAAALVHTGVCWTFYLCR